MVTRKETQCECTSVDCEDEKRDVRNELVLQTDRDRETTEKGELKEEEHGGIEQRNAKQWTGKSKRKPQQRKQYVRHEQRDQYQIREGEMDAVQCTDKHKRESYGRPPPGFPQVQTTQGSTNEKVRSIRPPPGFKSRDFQVLPQAKSNDSGGFSDEKSPGQMKPFKERQHKPQNQGKSSSSSRCGRPQRGQRETYTYRSKGKSQSGQKEARTEPAKCRDSKSSSDSSTAVVK